MTEDRMLTIVLVVNSVVNLIILWLVAPLYQIRGTLSQVTTTLKHHESRLLSLEERSSNGK